MTSELLAREAEYAARFPGKRVVVRDPEWGAATLNNQSIHFWETCADREWGAARTATDIIKPNMVVMRAPESKAPEGKNAVHDDVFLRTNAYGMNGDEIDFSKQLIAVYGDSVVQGHGSGWIQGYSDLLPGYQVLNAGVGSAMVQFTGLRAIELNRRLPIAYNVFLVGQNISPRPVPALKTLYVWLHKLCDMLPGVILCTQPIPFHEDLTPDDIAPMLAKKGELPYKAGFYLVDQFVRGVKALFDFNVRHNEVIWRVAEERARLHGQNVPVVDLYQRLYSQGQSDFREHFVDNCHFREESYPYVWNILCAELAKVVDRSEQR